MQHFQTYQKWNERLFEEHVDAFRAGRLEKDPSCNWYVFRKVRGDEFVEPL
jgi:hypothetical protein